MYGHNGKILRIDLATQTYSVEHPDEVFYRTYGGGRGFVAYYLLNEVPAVLGICMKTTVVDGLFLVSRRSAANTPGSDPSQAFGERSASTVALPWGRITIC